jgi:hypothetical protein
MGVPVTCKSGEVVPGPLIGRSPEMPWALVSDICDHSKVNPSSSHLFNLMYGPSYNRQPVFQQHCLEVLSLGDTCTARVISLTKALCIVLDITTQQCNIAHGSDACTLSAWQQRKPRLGLARKAQAEANATCTVGGNIATAGKPRRSSARKAQTEANATCTVGGNIVTAGKPRLSSAGRPRLSPARKAQAEADATCTVGGSIVTAGKPRLSSARKAQAEADAICTVGGSIATAGKPRLSSARKTQADATCYMHCWWQHRH